MSFVVDGTELPCPSPFLFGFLACGLFCLFRGFWKVKISRNMEQDPLPLQVLLLSTLLMPVGVLPEECKSGRSPVGVAADMLSMQQPEPAEEVDFELNRA